jgi:hypothetical protein
VILSTFLGGFSDPSGVFLRYLGNLTEDEWFWASTFIGRRQEQGPISNMRLFSGLCMFFSSGQVESCKPAVSVLVG